MRTRILARSINPKTAAQVQHARLNISSQSDCSIIPATHLASTSATTTTLIDGERRHGDRPGELGDRVQQRHDDGTLGPKSTDSDSYTPIPGTFQNNTHNSGRKSIPRDGNSSGSLGGRDACSYLVNGGESTDRMVEARSERVGTSSLEFVDVRSPEATDCDMGGVGY